MKHYIKKILKIARMVLLLLVGLIILYFAVAFVCSRITVAGETGKSKDLTIYIKTNGVHTDIVVPVNTEQMDWSSEVKYTNVQSADTNFRYLAFGWGDKGFYLQIPQWSDLKFSVAFNAAFGLSTTAIHATFYRKMTEDKTCRKIVISSEQYARLIAIVSNSFAKDDKGHFILINTKANYGPTDAFYEANGRYNLFYTCNSWANSVLKNCGQKSCLWTIFDTGIFLKYNN